jgi:superfamily II DNA/RNA helicase
VHRIGRTGRAGKKGVAVTFVDWDDMPRWGMIDRSLDLGYPEPEETYSNSPHLFDQLSIPTGIKGTLPRASRVREGLDAEKVEDLGETGKRGGPGGDHADRGGRGSGGGRRDDRGGRGQGRRGGDGGRGSGEGRPRREAPVGETRGPREGAPAEGQAREGAPKRNRNRKRRRSGGGQGASAPAAE